MGHDTTGLGDHSQGGNFGLLHTRRHGFPASPFLSRPQARLGVRCMLTACWTRSRPSQTPSGPRWPCLDPRSRQWTPLSSQPPHTRNPALLQVQTKILQAEKPGLVVFSGDMVSGFAWDGSSGWFELKWRQLIAPAQAAGVPYATILGARGGGKGGGGVCRSGPAYVSLFAAVPRGGKTDGKNHR